MILAAVGVAGCGASQLHRARTELRAGRVAEARSAIEAFVEEYPHDPDGAYWLARIASSQNDMATARALMDRSEDLPISHRNHMWRLRQDVSRRLHNEAIAAWENGDVEVSLEHWADLRLLEPDELEYRRWWSYAALATGDTSEAYGHLIELAVTGHHGVEVLDPLAAVALARGDWARAHDQVVRAIASHGPSPFRLRVRATALERMERLPEAIVAFEAAVAAEPQARDLHLALGRLLMRTGDLEPATAVLVRAAEEIDPAGEIRDAEVWTYLGECQFQLGRLEEARSTFERLTELDSTDAVARGYLDIIAQGRGVDDGAGD